MSNDSQFIEEVLDIVSRVTDARARRMFGGHGIFSDDRMFALVAGNELFLKADADSEHWFVAAGMEKFEYTKPSGEVFRMSYFRAPESIFEDEDDTRLWVRRALDAALRARKKRR